jgi:polyisoprenoid-binding protein YceI
MRLTRLLPLPLLLLSSLAVAQDAPAADEAPAGPPPPVTYDLSKSDLIIQVFKDEGGLASGLAHNHAIKATKVSGSFTWDAADPAACKLTVTVPVSSLSPDETAVRKQVGLEGEIADGQREDIKKNMLASDQLDGANHKEITFVSSGCSGAGDKITLKGNLSIRGKARAVSVPVSFSADASSFSAKGKLTINATDFGFEPYSAMFGQIGNRNDMKLHVNLGGKAQ